MAAILVTANAWAAPQSIIWESPADVAVLQLNHPYPLSATASSGLPVAFRVKAGPATISDGMVVVTNVGTVMVEAEQSGDSVFLPVRETRTVNQVAVQATLAGSMDTTSAQAVQVVDNIAYVADLDAGLQIIDARDPANLNRMSGFDTTGQAWDVQVVGNLAYIADGPAGLQVIDVGNPAKPVRIAGFDTEGFSTGVCVAGNLVLVADGDAGLQLFDAKTLFRLGGIDTVGRCWQVKVSGTLAYLADDTGLQIVDIRNPAEPIALGRYNSPGANSLGVDVAGGFAYLAGQSLYIVDGSDPVAPHLVAQYAGGGIKVEITGNLAYLATVHDGLQIIDITAPDRPLLVGKLDTDGYAVDVRVVGDRAYVADSGAGLKVVRLDQVIPQTISFTPPISVNPADSPIVLHATVSSGLPVTFSVVSGPAKVVSNLLVLTGEGNVVVRAEQTGEGVITPITAERSIFVTKTPQSINWESPANRSVLALNEARPLIATASSGLPVSFRVAHGPAVVSAGMVTATNVGTIVVTAEQAGDDRNRPVSVARTFNQSATPEWFGSYDTSGFAGGLQVEGSLAYVADGSAGLQIVDVGNPAAPVRLGGYNTSGLASWAQVVGNIAYVADGSAGLQILDVGNPATPIRLGGFDTSGSAHYVQVVGNLAYVADGGAGLQIIDVGNPAKPIRLGSFPTSFATAFVQVIGNLAYVADSGAGLLILDVGNPAAPVRLGGYDTSGFASWVQVVGSIAYVADGSAGLQLLDVGNPANPTRVGGLNIGGSALSVSVIGSVAYVPDGGDRLRLVAVDDPAAPMLFGSYYTRSSAQSAQIKDDLLYVSGGIGGLHIFKLHTAIAQALSFTVPFEVSLADSPISLPASSDSGLPVTIRVVSGPATIDNGVVLLSAEGTVVLRAEQLGNQQFLPTSIERSFSVLAPLVLAPPIIKGGTLVLSWSGGRAPFTVVRRENVDDVDTVVEATDLTTVTVPADGPSAFFRVYSW